MNKQLSIRDYQNIRIGTFMSRWALDEFKKRLPKESKILREEEDLGTYDTWRLTWWQPESKLSIQNKEGV